MPPRQSPKPRRARTREPVPAESPATEPAAEPQPANVAVPAPTAGVPTNTPIATLAPATVGRKRIYAGIILTFVVINAIIVFLLRGVDDELKWSQELRAVDDAFAAGRAKDAAEDLLRFGDRWPDAKKTYGFNEKAGRYLGAAGDWKRAAEFYEKAAALRPTQDNVAAAAGEAQWQAGNRERAFELFKREILSGNADNDLANLRLAQQFIETKDYLRAGEFMQAVRDREKYATELDAARAAIEAEVLAPARTAAEL